MFLKICIAYTDNGNQDDLVSPWDSNNWRLALCLLPHVKQFILTTPRYIIWPPTLQQFQTTLNQWTAQIRRSGNRSQLQEIVVHCASGDEGESFNTWQEDDGIVAYGLDGSHLGVNWVWAKQASGKWDFHGETSQFISDGEEYLFGPGNNEYEETWFHRDVMQRGKVYRMQMKREKFQVGTKVLE